MNIIYEFIMRPLKNIKQFSIACVLTAVLAGILLPPESAAFAQESSAKEYALKAVFLYNFSRYIKWDEEHSSGPFVIGILGESGILKPLEDIAQKKKVGERPIEIKRYQNIDSIQPSHVLYVDIPDRKKLSLLLEAMERIKNSNVLVITDCEGGAKLGAALNFIVLDGKVRFELNNRAIEHAGLVASSQLKKIAVMVKEE